MLNLYNFAIFLNLIPNFNDQYSLRNRTLMKELLKFYQYHTNYIGTLLVIQASIILHRIEIKFVDVLKTHTIQ